MPDTQQPMVLVVDDVPRNMQVLGYILRECGYRVTVARSGEEALEFVQKQLPDCILLDIMMPGLDGFETCRRLKDQKMTSDIPVLFITAFADTSHIVRAFEVGGVDYITKPFQTQEVVARVKTHVTLRTMQRKLQAQNEELLRQKKILDFDLKAAARIQRSLIPAVPPVIPNIKFAWQFVPCQQVGGDIFHIFQVDPSHVVMYLADVSGHGMASAMLTVPIVQALSLNTHSLVKKPCTPENEIISPVEVLEALDRDFPLKQFRHFFSIVYLTINPQTGHVRYAKAGHPPPILVRHTDRLELLEANGPLIGMNTPIPFEEGALTLQPHDRLFLYTDGITESFDAERQAIYGEERLQQTLLNLRTASLEDACQQVLASVTTYTGDASLEDDVTLVALEYSGLS